MTSPVLTNDTVLLNFPDAIREVLNGQKLTRVVWDDPDAYIFMQGEFLSIHTNGTDHQLIVSLGDMEGIDWYVLTVTTHND
jgi:hypothetical protein